MEPEPTINFILEFRSESASEKEVRNRFRLTMTKGTKKVISIHEDIPPEQVLFCRKSSKKNMHGINFVGRGMKWFRSDS